VVDAYPNLDDFYRKKYDISRRQKIATAGSCFAQHIARRLRAAHYNVMDKEPAPKALPRPQHEAYGYSMYSCRYGNIYTVQQLLQLAQEAFGERNIDLPVWQRDGRFFDALRPGTEPNGFASHEDVLLHRAQHVKKVRALFLEMDILIFTMGLTEHWYDSDSDLILPMAPGTIAGCLDESRHVFRNAAFNDVIRDFNAFQTLLRKHRDGRGLRCLLTVSPVPLTATSANRHVLVSTVASKAILRAAAGQLSENQPHIDYFPSFEIVTHPAARSMNYANNLRSVRPEAVEQVMKVFFSEHRAADEPSANSPEPAADDSDDFDMFVKCEEEILERFAND